MENDDVTRNPHKMSKLRFFRKNLRGMYVCAYDRTHRVPISQKVEHLETCPSKEIPTTRSSVSSETMIKFDEIMTCPYDGTHKIERTKYQSHVEICAKKNPDWCVCIYDDAHRMPISKLKKHLEECPTKKMLAATVHERNQNGGNHVIDNQNGGNHFIDNQNGGNHFIDNNNNVFHDDEDALVVDEEKLDC